nr:hypothetical protein [Micromonospora sp. DSM 115978]
LTPLAPALLLLTAPMWLTIGAVIAFTQVLGFLVRQGELVQEKIEALIQAAVNFATEMGVTKENVGKAVNEIVTFFTDFKNQVQRIFSDSGSWLEIAGRLIMLGLRTALEIGWAAVTVWFRSIKNQVTSFFGDAGTWLL